MPEGVFTTDSAANDAPPATDRSASGEATATVDTAAAETLRVDFYVLDEASGSARLKLACRLVEKAYLAGHRALVWHTDASELQAFDELLWTFMDGSFVPHDLLGASGADDGTPVLLSAGAIPATPVDVIINLSAELPACLPLTRRVAEIVDGEDARRKAARARFKAYRERGVQPASHNMRSE